MDGLASLSTPLHLAASLLACFASAGLAIVVVARPGGNRTLRGIHVADAILALGGLSFAVGHGLAGALLDATPDTLQLHELVTWLQTGGLVLMAVGVSRPRLRDLTAPAVLVPVQADPAAAWISAAAGVVGAGRALAAGRRGLPIAIGLLAWGGAAPVRDDRVALSAVLTVAGSLAVGWWVWQASARSLRAKLVTASVALLLAVVVLIAGASSGVGSQDIVDDELRTLVGLSESVARELEREWLDDAMNAATILRGPEVTKTLLEGRSTDLKLYFDAFFGPQDQEFLVVLDANGRILSHYDSTSETGELSDSFLLQVQGAPAVEELLEEKRGTGEARRASLLQIGGEFVAVGGIPLWRGASPEAPAVGAVLTGRRADAAWADQAAGLRSTEIVVSTVGGRNPVGSPALGGATRAIATHFRTNQEPAKVTVRGKQFYAAAATINDLDSRADRDVGRVVAVSQAEALTDAEREETQLLFLLALLGALLSGLAAAFISGRLAAPIRRLTAVAASVREGNLNVTANVASPDEVGVLGRTFDEMMTSLSAQSAQLHDAASVQTRLRARLEALTSSMSDALIAVNPDGKVVTFNPAAQRLVGRDITEVLGLPLDQVLMGQANNDQSPAEALGAFDSEETVAVQLLLERSDGRYVPTAVTAAPVHDVASGQILGRVLVLRDVTREREIERMKTEFLSNVSHELRTPLTPIKGYAEVLARRDVGADATRKFAAQILDSTGRLERIVATIVDFAALDSGRLELRPQPLALHDVIEEMLVEWREAYPGREFRRRAGKTLPAAQADPVMLRRCLDELVSNAVKFSPNGGPVSVTAMQASYGREPRPFVRISVRDRGVGIEPDVAARIFGDFYQGDASETRHYGGLGLGLALVRRIVEGMEGHVDLESHAGEGSTFHLFLPLAHRDDII